MLVIFHWSEESGSCSLALWTGNILKLFLAGTLLWTGTEAGLPVGGGRPIPPMISYLGIFS